jgi:Leu/Phe-tRNA-protein transferase
VYCRPRLIRALIEIACAAQNDEASEPMPQKRFGWARHQRDTYISPQALHGAESARRFDESQKYEVSFDGATEGRVAKASRMSAARRVPCEV